MPADALGEVVGAAVELAAELVSAPPEPPKRGRLRRLLYWSVVAGLIGLVGWMVYLALS
jgi:hypothetical protein